MEWTGERLVQGHYTNTTAEHLHRYALAGDLAPGLRVADAACGEGYGSHLIARAGAASVIGVDIEPACVAHAIATYRVAGLSFAVGSVTELPLADDSIDLFVSFETIEHVDGEAQQTMMREIRRVLAPGGALLISSPNAEHYGEHRDDGEVNPFHHHELSREAFAALVAEHFAWSGMLQQTSDLYSLVAPEQGGGELREYRGDFAAVVGQPGLARPVFSLCLAADEPRELPAPSVFRCEPLLARMLADERDAVRRTLSYRIGNAILSPLKLLRRLAGGPR